MSSKDTKNLRGTIIFIDHVRIRPGAGPDSPKIRPGTADPKTRKFNYKNVILELGFGVRTQTPIPDLKIAKNLRVFDRPPPHCDFCIVKCTVWPARVGVGVHRL